MKGKYRYLKIAFPLFSFLAGFFLVPNIFKAKEEKAFSNRIRLEQAKVNYHVQNVPDSVELVPGEYYDRGPIVRWILGDGYRELWKQKIKVPVLRLYEKGRRGFSPVEFSGGMQTIGIRLKDSSGNTWAVRSVNKDQAAALPTFLRWSILRSMFRDQASSINPYGALVVSPLAAAVEIHYDQPALYLFPYQPGLGKYNTRMAGRLVILMPYRAKGTSHFRGEPTRVLDTEDLLELSESPSVKVDTVLYLRNRLFDMLISDWDRHEGNWMWMVKNRGSDTLIEPVAVDRDMALYQFGDGLLNRFSKLFVNIFQSFTTDYKSIEGLMEQSEALDLAILGQLKEDEFLKQATFIQRRLGEEIIEDAFRRYPKEVYSTWGKEHQQILRERLKRLPAAARKFHDLIQEKKK